MWLVHEAAEHEDELRADLQHYYGIDLDHAMAGEHSAGHVAALAFNLPPGSCLKAAIDPDAGWTRTDMLLAMLVNLFNALNYGMSDRKKRGPEPKRVGPSWMTKGDEHKRNIAKRALPVDRLMEILSLPRRG